MLLAVEHQCSIAPNDVYQLLILRQIVRAGFIRLATLGTGSSKADPTCRRSLSSSGEGERDRLWDFRELELRERPPWDDWLLLLDLLRSALGDWSLRVVALESLLSEASDPSLSIFLVQLVDSLWKRLVRLWTNRQWYFARSQFMRTKQTEMKGNGPSVLVQNGSWIVQCSPWQSHTSCPFLLTYSKSCWQCCSFAGLH